MLRFKNNYIRKNIQPMQFLFKKILFERLNIILFIF